jgi:hypothetical protein
VRTDWLTQMLERYAIVGFGGLEPERNGRAVCCRIQAVGWARAVLLGR